MKFRYFIGLDLLMWGSDFPHSVGTFPHSQEVIDELFEDVPENERHQVLVENACEFYGLDPRQQLTPTPA
jgi:predicted TIM-barrel fold metal-dependent hydrolase